MNPFTMKPLQIVPSRDIHLPTVMVGDHVNLKLTIVIPVSDAATALAISEKVINTTNLSEQVRVLVSKYIEEAVCKELQYREAVKNKNAFKVIFDE